MLVSLVCDHNQGYEFPLSWLPGEPAPPHGLPKSPPFPGEESSAAQEEAPAPVALMATARRVELFRDTRSTPALAPDEGH